VGLTPVVSKASAGAMEFQVVHEAGNFGRFLKDSRDNGWDIIGTSATQLDSHYQHTHDNEEKHKDFLPVPESIFKYKITKPSIAILGNEGYGIDKKVLKQCTKLVYIPHSPLASKTFLENINCLNVSVATGIILSSLCQSATLKIDN